MKITKIAIGITRYGYEGGDTPLDIDATMKNQLKHVEEYFGSEYPDAEVVVSKTNTYKNYIDVETEDEDDEGAAGEAVWLELQELELKYALDWMVYPASTM